MWLQRIAGCILAPSGSFLPFTFTSGKNCIALGHSGPAPVCTNRSTVHIHDNCHRHRIHCLWSKTFHVEQFCFTWQAIWHHMIKLFVMWSNLSCGALENCSISVLWSYSWLLHMTNLQCMLSCCDLRCFVWSKNLQTNLVCGGKTTNIVPAHYSQWQWWLCAVAEGFRCNISGL